MMDVACTCDNLPAHSHVFKPVKTESSRGPVFGSRDTGEVRIWVDWKAVARELAQA